MATADNGGREGGKRGRLIWVKMVVGGKRLPMMMMMMFMSIICMDTVTTTQQLPPSVRNLELAYISGSGPPPPSEKSKSKVINKIRNLTFPQNSMANPVFKKKSKKQSVMTSTNAAVSWYPEILRPPSESSSSSTSSSSSSSESEMCNQSDGKNSNSHHRGRTACKVMTTRWVVNFDEITGLMAGPPEKQESIQSSKISSLASVSNIREIGLSYWTGFDWYVAAPAAKISQNLVDIPSALTLSALFDMILVKKADNNTKIEALKRVLNKNHNQSASPRWQVFMTTIYRQMHALRRELDQNPHSVYLRLLLSMHPEGPPPGDAHQMDTRIARLADYYSRSIILKLRSLPVYFGGSGEVNQLSESSPGGCQTKSRAKKVTKLSSSSSSLTSSSSTSSSSLSYQSVLPNSRSPVGSHWTPARAVQIGRLQVKLGVLADLILFARRKIRGAQVWHGPSSNRYRDEQNVMMDHHRHHRHHHHRDDNDDLTNQNTNTAKDDNNNNADKHDDDDDDSGNDADYDDDARGAPGGDGNDGRSRMRRKKGTKTASRQNAPSSSSSSFSSSSSSSSSSALPPIIGIDMVVGLASNVYSFVNSAMATHPHFARTLNAKIGHDFSFFKKMEDFCSAEGWLLDLQRITLGGSGGNSMLRKEPAISRVKFRQSLKRRSTRNQTHRDQFEAHQQQLKHHLRGGGGGFAGLVDEVVSDLKSIAKLSTSSTVDDLIRLFDRHDSESEEPSSVVEHADGQDSDRHMVVDDDDNENGDDGIKMVDDYY